MCMVLPVIYYIAENLKCFKNLKRKKHSDTRTILTFWGINICVYFLLTGPS